MLLSAEHLSINFGSRQLLDDVNFYLNEGDKTGIIGINGTGKSTFLKVLAGVTEADAGTISRNPNVQVSFLSQNPVMDDNATVLEQVFLHFPAEFRELNEYEAKSMLNKLGVTDFDQKVGTLSGGQRKRVHPEGHRPRFGTEGLCRHRRRLYPRPWTAAAGTPWLRTLPQSGAGGGGTGLRSGSGSGKYTGLRILRPRRGLYGEMASGEGIYASGERFEGEKSP